MKDSTEMLKGSLEGVVLELISQGPIDNREIRKTLNEVGFSEVIDGMIYTILNRIERKNWVSIEKRKSNQGPSKKVYQLNEAGTTHLAEFWQRWDQLSKDVLAVRKKGA